MTVHVCESVSYVGVGHVAFVTMDVPGPHSPAHLREG